MRIGAEQYHAPLAAMSNYGVVSLPRRECA